MQSGTARRLVRVASPGAFRGARLRVSAEAARLVNCAGVHPAHRLSSPRASVVVHLNCGETTAKTERMTEMPYDLLIVDHANASVRETAAEIGATHMRLITTGHNGDDRITLFAIDAPGRELRVIETADDSVWEDDDPDVFFKMLEQYGIAK
jgi:hypothetical protein